MSEHAEVTDPAHGRGLPRKACVIWSPTCGRPKSGFGVCRRPGYASRERPTMAEGRAVSAFSATFLGAAAGGRGEAATVRASVVAAGPAGSHLLASETLSALRDVRCLGARGRGVVLCCEIQ